MAATNLTILQTKQTEIFYFYRNGIRTGLSYTWSNIKHASGL